MKPFQTVHQSLRGWWRDSKDNLIKDPLWLRLIPNNSCLPPKKANSPPNVFQKVCGSRRIRQIHPPVMLGITVMSLTGVIGYRFYNQPQLAVGNISPITVTAPKDARFLDGKTTEERRKDLAKLAGKYAEQQKVAIRNVRRDANDDCRKAQKDSVISEDEAKRFEGEVQKITDEAIKRVDEVLKSKEQEIMHV